MKFKALTTAMLVATMGLSTARPGLSQTDLNAQLQQNICTQNWSRAIQVVDQMKKVASPGYASQLTMYRGRLEAMASSGARVPSNELNCSAGGIAISTNSAPARVANINAVGTDQAFLADYRRLVANEKEPSVRNLLLDTFDNSPNFGRNGLTSAKATCKLLRLGDSWNEIQANEANAITATKPLVRKAQITNIAITNVLATTHYCPEFVNR